MGGDEDHLKSTPGSASGKKTQLEELLELTSKNSSVIAKGFSAPEPHLCVLLSSLFSSPERLTEVFSKSEVLDPGSDGSSMRSGINFSAVKTLYNNIRGMDVPSVTEAVLGASRKLLEDHNSARKEGSASYDERRKIVNSYLIIFANPLLLEPENHSLLELLAKALTRLDSRDRALAVSALASLKGEDLEELIATVQQCITVQLYEASRITEAVQLCTKLLKLLYDANIKSAHLPISVFYNDAVNTKELVNPEKQYLYWRHPQRYAFSFCNYPFILDLATKSGILNLDSHAEMQNHFHRAIFHGLFHQGGIVEPFNVMRVRRDHLIHDAITHVQRRREELKKPLRVQFIGEDAVDEGGVRKEFFQLVVQELFDPKYGMFSYKEETRQFWFSLQGGELAHVQEEQEVKFMIELQKKIEEEEKREQGKREGATGVDKHLHPMEWTEGDSRVAENSGDNSDPPGSARRMSMDEAPQAASATLSAVSAAEPRPRPGVEDLEMSREYELVGMLLGLAIYNHCILEVRFPPVLYKKLLRRPLGLEDLESLDKDLAKGLKDLLAFDGDVEEVFELNFQVTVEDIFGDKHLIDLKPGGGDIPLTKANRQEYVDLCIQFYLDSSIHRQFVAFEKGFKHLVPEHMLKLFEPEELELLICGISELDMDDLQKGAHYTDGYTAEHTVIREFWEIVHALPESEKKNLLMFVTGCDRAPVRGLSSLKFTISRNGPDTDRLPTAHTCFNHLLLPEYKTKEKLKDRLLTAINNAKGFGLQ